MGQRVLFSFDSVKTDEHLGAEIFEHGDQFQKENQKKAGVGQAVTASGIRQKMQEQDWRCALSGVDLSQSAKDTELDHIVPLSKGGAHVLSNVQLVHRIPNAMKRTMTEQVFLKWCRRIVEHANQAEKLKKSGFSGFLGPCEEKI
jgi:hypothetical protein